jgi:hypothetical protein
MPGLPAVDRGEQFARLLHLALVAPDMLHTSNLADQYCE